MSWDTYRESAEEQYIRQQDIAAQEHLEEEERKTQQTLLSENLDYFQGNSDGKGYLPPKDPNNYVYWEGYCGGLRDYWIKALKLPDLQEF
jgi:hypothetical protein